MVADTFAETVSIMLIAAMIFKRQYRKEGADMAANKRKTNKDKLNKEVAMTVIRMKMMIGQMVKMSQGTLEAQEA